MSLEHVNEIVAKADTDGDGTVNRQEYLNAVAADVMPTIIVDDVDDDGVIDVEPEEPRAEEAGAGRGGAMESRRGLGALGAGRPLVASRGGRPQYLERRFSRGGACRGAGPDVGGRRAGGAAGDRRGRPVCWGRRDDVRRGLRLGRR